MQYQTLAQLVDSSPSRRDGLTPEQEARWTAAAVDMVAGAAGDLRMDYFARFTAVTYLRRFYARRSMLRNDRFLVGAACLYLAGKADDSPKSARDVLAACARRAWGEPRAAAAAAAPGWADAARARLFRAERALLYALGFDFAPASAPFHALQLMRRHQPFFDGLPPGAKGALSSVTWVLAATATSRTRLQLQMPPQALAAACLWLAVKLLRVDDAPLDAAAAAAAAAPPPSVRAAAAPPPPPRNAPPPGRWWRHAGLTPALIATVEEQLLDALFGPDAGRARELAGDAGARLEAAGLLGPPAKRPRVEGGAGGAPPAAAAGGDEELDYDDLLAGLGS